MVVVTVVEVEQIKTNVALSTYRTSSSYRTLRLGMKEKSIVPVQKAPARWLKFPSKEDPVLEFGKVLMHDASNKHENGLRSFGLV